MGVRQSFSSTLESARKRFFDTFVRANSTGLGTATDGSRWDAIRGVWSVSSNTAVADSASYPMSTVTMPTSNNSVEVVNQGVRGAGAALWVTGSGDWWAIGITQDAVSCNCVSAWNIDSWNATNCNHYAFSYCTYYRVCNAYNIVGWNCNAWNAAKNCRTVGNAYYSPQTSGNCASFFTGCTAGSSVYVCDTWTAGTANTYYYTSCSTCYPVTLRLFKSIASAITEVTNWAVSSMPSSMRFKTSGSQITAQMYSDSNFTTQIGSDIVYTPTGVTVSNQFGITIVPSNYAQGTTIYSTNITRN